MLTEQPRYDKLPENFREPVRRYIEDGKQPGDTLCAILTNNLLDSVCRLQPDLLSQLKDIVLWFHWEVPALCWGCPTRVRLWIETGGASGIQDWAAYNETLRARIEGSPLKEA